MTTISVIIPAYNAEKTIAKTINSAIQQTFSDFDIIVINDGSTDKTLEIIQNIHDDRLKIFSYENSGASAARNRGIAHATGDYISFLDADDLWTPDKLELQLAALQAHPEAGVAYSWTYIINGEGELLRSVEHSYEGNVYGEMLLSSFVTCGSNPLIRKEAIDSVGEFDVTLKSGDDWDYWLRLAYKWHFVVVPKHQIFYLRSVTSKSFKLKIIRECTIKVLDKAIQLAPLELQYLRNHSLSNIYIYNVQLYLDSLSINSNVDIKYVLGNWWQSIRYKPDTLQNKETYKLLIKILLIGIISPKLMSSFLDWFRKIKQTKKLQIQP